MEIRLVGTAVLHADGRAWRSE